MHTLHNWRNILNAKLAAPVTTHISVSVLLAGIVWLLSYLAARYALATFAPAPHWDIVVAGAPVFAFFWFIWVVQRTLRTTDELRRRIHLEALALAFLTTLLVLMMLGLLDGSPAGHLRLPLRDLWFVLPVLYAICLAAVSQHYR